MTGDKSAAAAPASSSQGPAPAPAAEAGGRSPGHHGLVATGFLLGVGFLIAWWLGSLLLSISGLILLIVVALFLAAGLSPAVQFFVGRGLSHTWALVVVFAAVLAAVTLFFVALVPVITDQVTAIVDNSPGWLRQLQENPRVQSLEDEYQVIDKLESFITSGDWASGLFGGVIGIGLALLGFLANAFIVVVLTLYFLASLTRIKESLYGLTPASRRARVEELGNRIFDSVGGYVAGAFVVAMTSGITSLIFLFIVGLGEYAIALAAVVALLGVIPMIGATIGAVLVSAIGFATDVKIGIACIVFYVIYQQVENYLIYPRVMQRSVDVPGAIIVIAAMIGAGLLGVVGALLALPTAAAILMLVKELWLPHQDRR